MTDLFDPYHEWLGIPPHEQPPHHYRLLGLSIFEVDAQRIRGEADHRMQIVRTYQLGKRSQASQTLLNELAAAKVCLLHPNTKARYDQALTEWLEARLPVPPPSVPPDSPPEGCAIVDLRFAIDGRADVRSFRSIANPSPLGAWGSAPVRGRRSEVGSRRTVGGWGNGRGWLLIPAMSVATVVVIAVLVANRRDAGAPHQGPVPVALPKSDQTDQSRLAGKTVVLPNDVVLQSDDGDVNLHLARAKLSGPTLKIDGDATADWRSPGDQVRWDFLIRRPGIFRIDVTYAAGESSAGGRARFELSGRSQPLSLSIRDTGGRDKFVTNAVAPMVQIRRGGQYTLKISAAESRGGLLLTLRGVQLHREPVP